MTTKEMARAANTINSRLRRARERFPNSEYTNELERRVVMLTTNTDLINITSDGVTLTRSKQRWAQAPEGFAEAILNDMLDLGNMSTYLTAKVDYIMDNSLDSHGKPIPITDENRRAFMEGVYNETVDKSKIWEIAYEMRTQNQELYDIFQELYGKKLPDNWDTGVGDEYTERIRKAMVYGTLDGEDRQKTYGLNQRKSEKDNAARAIGRYLGQPDPQSDPDTLARLFEQYGSAVYGTTGPGDNYMPADYTKLTPDQVRALLRKFLK